MSHCACRVKRVSVIKRSRSDRPSNFECTSSGSLQEMELILVNYGGGAVVDGASKFTLTSVNCGADNGPFEYSDICESLVKKSEASECTKDQSANDGLFAYCTGKSEAQAEKYQGVPLIVE